MSAKDTLRRLEALESNKSSDLRKINESIERARDKRSNLEHEIDTINDAIQLAQTMVDTLDPKQLDLFSAAHVHDWPDTWTESSPHIETRVCRLCHDVERRCIHEFGEPYQLETAEGEPILDEVGTHETLWRRTCAHCPTVQIGMAHSIDEALPDKCQGCETPESPWCYWKEILTPLPEPEAPESTDADPEGAEVEGEASDAVEGQPDGPAGDEGGEQPAVEEQAMLPGIESLPDAPETEPAEAKPGRGKPRRF